MCCYVDGTPYLWISFCIKKYLPFLVLMFSFIRMYLRVCLCENICMCIYVLYIYICYICAFLSVCGTRIQSLMLFSTVQKETSNAPRGGTVASPVCRIFQQLSLANR